MVKGQRSTFDSAVAIRIDVYRAETKKLKYGSQLIDSLSKALQSQIANSDLKSKLVNSLYYSNSQLNKRMAEKDSVCHIYYKNFISANQSLQKQTKKNWFEDWKTWLLLCVTVYFIGQ